MRSKQIATRQNKPTVRSSIQNEIIETLYEACDLLLEWVENPHAQRRRLRGTIDQKEWNQMFSESKKRRALNRLKKKQWIEHKREGDRIIYELQDEIIKRYLKDDIKITETTLPKDFILLIIFDFPEAARKARNAFRAFLKRSGFQQKQLSVWFTEKAVTEQTQSLIRLLGIEKWVKIFIAQAI